MGIKINGKRYRLKAGYGAKNAVVGLSWSASIALSLNTFSYGILAFFLFKLFTTSVAFDIRDRHEDTMMTLPKLLDDRIWQFLTGTNITGHTLAILLYGPHPILLASATITQLAIAAKGDLCRNIIDAEPTTSVLLFLTAATVLAHV